MPTYVVERYLPALSPDDLRAHVAWEREAIGKAAAAFEGVRHLRSTYLREDELCLSMFEAPSLHAVRMVNERAAIPFERITEAIDVPDEREEPRPAPGPGYQ